MTKLSISIVQTDIAWENPAVNIRKYQEIVRNIQQPPGIVVFPELCTTGFTMNNQDYAEDMQGETISAFKEMALRSGQYLVFGMIAKDKQNQIYNRLVVAAPDEQISYYDKHHLFRKGAEHKHYTTGNNRLIIEINGWRICPLICYDLRFPVWSRNQNDYDMLVYIANWPNSRLLVWETLLKARALENQVYVAGVNRVGTDDNGLYHSGHSMLISPKGKELIRMPETEDVQSIEISLDELNQFRQSFPVGLDADPFQLLNP